MVKDVQDWVAKQASNFGWLLKGDEGTNGTAVRLNSRQSGTGTPSLVITYTVPVVVKNTPPYLKLP